MIINEAPISIFIKYSEFVDVYSPELVLELLKYTKINDHAIKLVDDQQLFYELIYSLGSEKLEILKTYIETNLVNSFIKLFKSPAGTPSFFDKKSDKSFQLCIDYWGLNNLTIKNQYLLPLVRDFLD